MINKIEKTIERAIEFGSATVTLSKFDGIVEYQMLQKEAESNRLEIELVDEFLDKET